MKAQVLTQWIGDGLTPETANRPKIMDDYPAIQKFEDVTAQPSENLAPNPNLYIVQIECSQATLDAIKADSNFMVLWHE